MHSTSIIFIASEKVNDSTPSSTITGSLMYPQKKSFDSASYPERLKFWETNGADPECWRYEVTKGKEKISFSIEPVIDHEREQYFNWRIQLIKDQFKNTVHNDEWLKRWDFNSIKEDYFLKIKNDENNIETIEYCKSKIKELEKELSNELFKLGFEHVNGKKEIDLTSPMYNQTYFDFESFLKGMNAAKLISFYKAQILELGAKLKKKSKDEIAAPTIKLFCEIVNHSNLMPKIETDVSAYCKRVCEAFGLTYTTNVRKYFSPKPDIKSNDKNLIKLKQLILPRIPDQSRIKIEAYIDEKLKLYS